MSAFDRGGSYVWIEVSDLHRLMRLARKSNDLVTMTFQPLDTDSKETQGEDTQDSDNADTDPDGSELPF